MYWFSGVNSHNKESYLNFSPLEVKQKILKLEDYKIHGEAKIIDYAQMYYNTVVLPNTNIVDGTKRNYKKSINHFKNYLEYNGFCRLKILS